eukprot:COSAG03_NODE_465_length_7686_cov_24.051008_4_plen_43_part_00
MLTADHGVVISVSLSLSLSLSLSVSLSFSLFISPGTLTADEE